MRNRVVLLGSTAVGFATVLALHAGGTPAVVVAPPSTGGTNPSTPTTTVPATGGARQATGSTEQYGFGALSVTVSVQGTQIKDVTVASLQTAESYSQSLAQQVIPMLRNEVLNAQNTQVSTISGATYTSEAYLTSLQSALNALKA